MAINVLVLLLANFVDRANVGMIEGRSGAGLAAETFERLRVARDVIRKKFQSDEAAKFGVFRFVDDAHAATTEPVDDAVVRNCPADRRLRVRHERRIA